MVYDYIIIGAGLGGLASALNLVFNNKKILVLEKNSLPGGLVSTFKKGRFQFDTTLFQLYDYGDKEHVGELQTLFKKFEINVNTTLIPYNTRVKIENTKEDYEIKGTFEEFGALLEEFRSGSVEPIKAFIKATKEIHDALEELKKGKDPSENYTSFYKYLEFNALNALLDLKMPVETIHKISYVYLELGSPIHKLSFIDFAEFMYKVIFKKVVILKDKNLDMIFKMTSKIQSKGGKIYYNSEVKRIRKDGDMQVAVTSDGKEYRAKKIICDTSRRYVFKNLIKGESKEVYRLENARTLSPNSLIIYLGLNKDYKYLGFKNYHYYHFGNINSEENVASMMKLNHNTWEAIIPNIVDENASPKNTSILILKTDYYATNVFDKVTKSNYLDIKKDLANSLIEQFENAFNIDIKEYIEEIEVATPFTFREYTNNINGSMLGYMRLGYDNSIHRLLSYDQEVVPNVSFVGSASLFGGGANNAFISGYYVTNKLLEAERK